MSWTELHPVLQQTITTGLAVAGLIGLVLLIRKPFARRFGAKAAYALWALPAARLVLPPLPESFALSGWLGLGDPAEPAPQQPVLMMPHRLVLDEQVLQAVPLAPATSEPAISAAPATPVLLDMLATHAPVTLASLWTIGMLVWLGRSWHRQHQFLHLIELDSEPASEAVTAEARGIARQIGLRRMPAIRSSLLCSGPLVTGLVRPVILLPKWFEDDYSRTEQRDALVHELTHLKRHDLWAFQAARFVAATQWFNPLAWLALNAFRTDQEAACDADVLALGTISPAEYGRTLVKAARLARPSDRRLATASLTLAHPIKERLIMMQDPTPSLRRRLLGTATAGALGVAALFTTASCMAAQADDKERQTAVFIGETEKNITRLDGTGMILLGEPFEGLMPDMSDIDGADFDFDFDFTHDIEVDISEEMVELDAVLSELDVAGLTRDALHIVNFSMTGPDGQNIWVMKSGESAEDFEARIETWAEEIEKRAEDFELRSDEIEKRAEVIALRIEKKVAANEALREGRIAEMEARADAMAAGIEERFGEDFEAKMEGAAAVIESLHDQCEARGSDDPTPEVVSATNEATGQTFRAICVNGDGERLRSDALANWVENRSDLTDEEKARFKARQSGDQVLSTMKIVRNADAPKVVIHRNKSEVLVAPDAPPPVEAPAAPEK